MNVSCSRNLAGLVSCLRGVCFQLAIYGKQLIWQAGSIPHLAEVACPVNVETSYTSSCVECHSKTHDECFTDPNLFDPAIVTSPFLGIS